MTQQKIDQVVARYWSDPAFKAQMQSDPAAALTEAGLNVPAGLKVKVHEASDDTYHIIIPQKPEANIQSFTSSRNVGPFLTTVCAEP